MKNIFITTILLIFTTSALAQDYSEEGILELLVSTSGDVEVYDDSGYLNQLSAILAIHLLSNNHLDEDVGSSATLTNTSLSCDFSDTAAGSSFLDCTLVLGDGNYYKDEEGYIGPDTESALFLSFTVRYSNVSGESEIFNNKAEAFFAG